MGFSIVKYRTTLMVQVSVKGNPKLRIWVCMCMLYVSLCLSVCQECVCVCVCVYLCIDVCVHVFVHVCVKSHIPTMFAMCDVKNRSKGVVSRSIFQKSS